MRSLRIEQLHHEEASNQLLVLSSGLHLGERPRSSICAVDVATKAETARIEEFLETYGFCAFTSFPQASTQLYVAGAVYAGGKCPR